MEKAGLGEVYEKLEAGERLSREDGLNLFKTRDLLALGRLAQKVRVRLHGRRVYYVINRHLNYTNVCENRCRFCAYWRAPGDPEGYVLSPEEAVTRLSQGPPPREIHIVGGLHPELPYHYYLELLSAVHEAFPQAAIKAFTCVEIDHLSRISGKPVEEVLRDLKEAGLSCLPGGGAEIFSERVRRKLFPRKISAERWLEIARTAHHLGIPTNATMLYGHVETLEERVEHLLRLRSLQDETQGFLCFVPLPFLPEKTPLREEIRPTTGFEDLRVMAVSRLLLDNIPHLKAYWVFLGVKLAQLALHFGADDLHGTVVEEKISEASGGREAEALSREEIERLVRTAGFEPVERDAFYRAVAPEGV
ncbi:MAG: aminofutalosine synthase MqnE [Thermodesulfatator sp.]|nr:MAG: aminofutalosine synthase MqnE [Thermodesulfatator sp.]